MTICYLLHGYRGGLTYAEAKNASVDEIRMLVKGLNKIREEEKSAYDKEARRNR